MFTKLKENPSLLKNVRAKKNRRLTTDDAAYYEQVMNTTTEEIIREYEEYVDDPTLAYTYTIDDMKTYVFGFYYGQIDPVYNVTFDDVAPLSPELQAAVDNVMSQVAAAPDVQSIKNIFYNEMSNISSLSTQIDKFAFEGMLQIGIASTDYWNENLDDWYALLRPEDQLVFRQINGVQALKDALWGDMGGFVRGAIKGAVRGVWGGIQSAAVAGLVTGAYQGVVGSAGGAIEGAIRSWLGW